MGGDSTGVTSTRYQGKVNGVNKMNEITDQFQALLNLTKEKERIYITLLKVCRRELKKSPAERDITKLKQLLSLLDEVCNKCPSSGQS